MAGEDTLVVIEDDHHISDLVAMYLRRDGFRVLQAEDGAAGLALVDRERPKLVIVDIGLPGGLNGFDVCRRLRGDGSPNPRRSGSGSSGPAGTGPAGTGTGGPGGIASPPTSLNRQPLRPTLNPNSKPARLTKQAIHDVQGAPPPP